MRFIIIILLFASCSKDTTDLLSDLEKYSELDTIIPLRINRTGKKAFINAPGRPGTIYVNGGEEPSEPEPPGPTDHSTYLNFSLIGSDIDIINGGKGIKQKTGTTNGFNRDRFVWAFNEIEQGDTLIFEIDVAGMLSYVYLNETPYHWSNAYDEYAFSVCTAASSVSRVGMRDKTSNNVFVPNSSSYFPISSGDLAGIVYNEDGTATLIKSTTGGASWTVLSTSTYSTSGTLYAGIKTWQPTAGVAEIYVNRAVMYDYPTPLPAVKGAVLGNSLFTYVTTYVVPVDRQFFTVQERLAGCELDVLAVSGNTIPQQKAVWLAYAEKSTLDFVIIQCGVNNLYYLEGQSNATDIAQLQDLIQSVTDSCPGVPIIVSTLCPAEGRWPILWPSFPSKWTNAQASWEAINEAITGGGATPITGAACIASQHTIDLDDGTGYIADAYQVGDEIHTNGKGREINIRSLRQCLIDLELLAE